MIRVLHSILSATVPSACQPAAREEENEPQKQQQQQQQQQAE